MDLTCSRVVVGVFWWMRGICLVAKSIWNWLGALWYTKTFCFFSLRGLTIKCSSSTTTTHTLFPFLIQIIFQNYHNSAHPPLPTKHFPAIVVHCLFEPSNTVCLTFECLLQTIATHFCPAIFPHNLLSAYNPTYVEIWKAKPTLLRSDWLRKGIARPVVDTIA